MKEQIDSHSFVEVTESQQKKQDKKSKTRPIHKDKNNFGQDQPTDKQYNKLTKQERARLQKEKNREAAQKSRDTHKEYVSNLENELKLLKEEMDHSRRYCHRCQQILENEDTENFTQPNLQFNCENELPIPSDQSQMLNQPNKEYCQPQSFLRILEPQEEIPFMKLMLFVCMIVIAVMVGFNKEPAGIEPRGLMQVYTPPVQELIKADTTQIPAVEECRLDKGLVELNRGLEDQTCLDSLMRVESPVARKSLRSIHDSSYKQEMDSIMLCSLKMPKVYEIKPQLTDSPIVRLFVLGSEIKELVKQSGSWMTMLDPNIQLNGIYRLNAEVKSVELVSHHNCLL